ncbi:MAG: hypothetical protein ABRQ31_06850, partial [Smithellaceae bacterium]
GRYMFQIHGMGGDKPSDARHCMVFLRPHLGRIMLRVIGIIVVSTFIIGSIVLFGLRLTANN